MKILFAGGGTGGHLFPGIAIAQALMLMRPELKLHFVGTERGIEMTEVPKYGFTLHLISAAAIKRGWTLTALLENLRFPFRLKASIDESYRLLDQEEPSAVVGTGGYVSAPVVYAAQQWGIPTLIQEQNAAPGLATRYLARHADEVHVSFDETVRWFSRERVYVSGNPTRTFSEFPKNEALRFFGLRENRPTLLMFGGSLGARSMNQFMLKYYNRLTDEANIIWQTGRLDHEDIQAKVSNSDALWRNAFIDRMDVAYAASDVVMCRAGASTLAELGNLGKPSLLVPYPFATGNHQEHNAMAFVKKGAAELIRDHELNEDACQLIQMRLHDAKKREAMAHAARSLGKANAAQTVAAHVLALAEAFDNEN